MAHQHNDMDLTIDTLDEQIEALSQTTPHTPGTSLLRSPDARMVRDLRRVHASAAQTDKASLEQVLRRLHEHQEQRLPMGARSSEDHQSTQYPDDRVFSTDVLAERQLGTYHLLSLLDTGGFANVYLAEHIYLKTFHAIKVLQMHLFDEAQRQHFLEEARTIARLHHPHIVQVTDFGVENAVPFLVMSYASHGNLRQRHAEGSRVPLDTVVNYVAQVAGALQCAHDQHLVHRDIKPENLLLDACDEIMLSDFGIAIIAHNSHSQSLQNVVGTAHYMPPEQLRGRPRPASDQYALAALAYEWLSGQLPFDGETYLDIARQHLHAPVPLLTEHMPEISPAVAAVIDRALAKDPHRRFESIQAFADALERASRFGTMPDLAPSSDREEGHEKSVAVQREQFRQGRQPSRRLVLALFGSAGVLAAGSGYLGWRAFSSGAPSRVALQRKIGSLPPSPGDLGTTVFIYNELNNGINNPNNRYYIDTLAWSPDNARVLLAGSPPIGALPPYGKLAAWYALTGEQMLALGTYEGFGDLTEDVAGRGRYAAWSPDGTRVVTMTATVRQGADIPGGTSTNDGVYTLSASSGDVLLTLPTGGTSLAWASDGKSLALLGHYRNLNYTPPPGRAKDRHIVILDASTGHLLHDYDAEFMYNLDPPGPWQPWAPNKPSLDVWAPSARYLASFYNQSVNVWDILNRRLVSRYHGDGSDPVKAALAWSPDERYIASGWGSDVHISSALTGQHVFTYNGHSQTVKAITWSPDGSRLASGGDDQTVQIWEAGTGKLIYTYRQHTDSVIAVAWSPAGDYLASGGAPIDGTVHIWKAK